VLFSVSNLYATKRIRRDHKTGKIIKAGYGNETFFRVKRVNLNGFDHLCTCLDALTKQPFALVIRGEPLPETNLNHTRRVNHEDAEKGYQAAFTEAARHWFAVDIDKVKKPVAIDPVSNPDAAIEFLIGLLPPSCTTRGAGGNSPARRTCRATRKRSPLDCGSGRAMRLMMPL